MNSTSPKRFDSVYGRFDEKSSFVLDLSVLFDKTLKLRIAKRLTFSSCFKMAIMVTSCNKV